MPFLPNHPLTPLELMIVGQAVNFLAAIAILVIGWLVAGWAARFIRYTLRHIPHFDYTLRPLLASLVRYAIIGVTVIAVLQRFGVETTSLIAVVGATGLAIGLALQGTLANVASGVMLLILRPFERGDYISVDKVSDEKLLVREIGLFRTQVATRGNIHISIPNSSVFEGAITNFSRETSIRVDFTVPVDYVNDIDAAEKLIVEALKSDPHVLNSPEPMAGVKSLEEYSVVLLARCWVSNADQYRAPFVLKKVVKSALHKAGILIPVTRQAAAERLEGPPSRTSAAG